MNQIASECVLEILLWPTIILVQSLLTLAPLTSKFFPMCLLYRNFWSLIDAIVVSLICMGAPLFQGWGGGGEGT